jgi:hypothetical protein
MKLFNAYLLLLLFFFALSSHATDLNDLESRIDQMLKRLNKVENSQTVPPLPPVTPSIKEELPSIDLAPLPPPITNRSSEETETSKTFNQLEGRIDELLKRLEINPSTAPAYQPSPTPKPEHSVTELPIIDLETDPSVYSRTYSLPKESSPQDFNAPPLPKNRFNFYFGLSIPNDSTFSESGNHNLEFGNGFELGVEYNRMFEDESYIGAFVEGKFFDTEKISGVSTSGDNRLLNLGFTLGQDWSFSELLALKTQASIGTSITHYEIDLVNYSANSLGFHYSFLAGLEFRWNEYWQTSLYYEFDGRSSADRMDYQSFHQLGIETGIGF